jgi:integrase
MATLMLGAGIHPKVVQERLGHKSIQITPDRYSHVSMTMQEEAAAVLNRLLTGEARPRRGHQTG